MARFSAHDRYRIDAISAELGSFKFGAPPALTSVMRAIRDLLDAEKGAAYCLARRDEGYSIDLWHTVGMRDAAVRADFEQVLSAAAASPVLYDPVRPEAKQRNRALRAVDLEALYGWKTRTHALRTQMYARHDLDRLDEIRMLVCEGSVLLAWIGCFRQDAFTVRERRLLGALAPALRQRLSIERQLAHAPLLESALAAALEMIPAATFVVGPHSIEHANLAGKAVLERDPKGIAESLRDALAGRPTAKAFSVNRLAAPGISGYALAMLHHTTEDVRPRAAMVINSWELTPRQGEVLQLVARGMSNKSISAELCCAEPTVEKHISALLNKAGVDSRAALVARFWTASS
jgi:DNA-binding CsgD family transcriptional regulator